MAMSIVRSTSVESSASSVTTTMMSQDGGRYNTATALYDDREHHQAIFSNDSRFFDTSLHLFRCYRDMGYVNETNKTKTGYFSNSATNLSPSSHERKGRLRGAFRLFSTNPTGRHSGSFKISVTPTLRRNYDDSKGLRPSSEIVSNLVASPRTPTRNRDKSPMFVQYQPRPEDDDDDDDDNQNEPDVIITRL